MPPVVRLTTPILKFRKAAFRSNRLIDFKTGSPDLQAEHEVWLKETAQMLPAGRNFHVFIIGYASKLGFHGAAEQSSDDKNVQLSFARASSVARLMEGVNARVTTRIDQFLAHGNHDYVAIGTDNSSFWRAVEVHVFLDEAPPPPPNVGPPPPCSGRPALSKVGRRHPGRDQRHGRSRRHRRGESVVFRKEEGAPIVHWYFAPGVGAGFSVSLPSTRRVKDLVKELIPPGLRKFLGLPSASGMSFTSFTAETPFNFGDLDGATCRIESLGVGAIAGFLAARLSVDGQVWFRDSSGKCMFAHQDFFSGLNVSGPDLPAGNQLVRRGRTAHPPCP